MHVIARKSSKKGEMVLVLKESYQLTKFNLGFFNVLLSMGENCHRKQRLGDFPHAHKCGSSATVCPSEIISKNMQEPSEPHTK